MSLITIISLAMFGFMIFGAIAIYFVITAPVALPFLKAKLNKGMVIILQTQTGKREIIATDKHFKNKRYGAFLPVEDATWLVQGVPMAQGHIDLSVIPTQAACQAAQKMDDNASEVYTTLETSAANAEQQGVIDKSDARALYRYASNVTPNYVNSRIEHRVAEILASQRNDIGKVFSYAIVFIMIMIGAGIAYSMVQGGGASAVADSVANTVSTVEI